MKKVFSCFLVFALVLSFSSTSTYASETATFQISEIEFMQYLLSLSDQELLEMGCTADEMDYFRNHDFNQDVLDFAQESKLHSNYSEQDIQILKSYNGLSDAISYLGATPYAGATLTFKLSKSSMTSSVVKLKYSSTWSSCPIWTATDIIAVTWRISNKSSIHVNSKVSSSEFSALYYKNGNMNSPLGDLGKKPVRVDDGFESFYYNIQMSEQYYDYSSEDKAIAMKTEGNFNVKTSAGSSNINTIELLAAYGHSQLAGTPSVSFSFGGVDLGISFSWYVYTEHKEKYSFSV